VRAVSLVRGPVAVLDRPDVDTDQIIPKQFLKRIERTGFGEFLFYDWRREPGFELNRPEAEGAQILVAGANFGCGSSREHAAWALQDYGFGAIVAPSFGDIFATNAFKIGLVTITLPPADVRALMDLFTGGGEAEVDLEGEVIVAPGGREIPFHLDPFQRHCLLNGLDDIARSLAYEDELTAYEAAHPARIETTALVP
jgi:3-isopropylmalate/(R)-2-methylmalate dehydratase small subunit